MTLSLTPLILAGGKSTRMGAPKHLLPLPDGTPLYARQISILRQACPGAPTIYISLAQDSPRDAYLSNLPDPGVKIIYDEESSSAQRSGGPAQGLLAAFASDPSATWLVLAVDYPLMTAGALGQLQEAHEPPVTCFRNGDGFCEPLVGVWGPDALRRLQERGRRVGPSAVVRELKGKEIEIRLEMKDVLKNINTVEEYADLSRTADACTSA